VLDPTPFGASPSETSLSVTITESAAVSRINRALAKDSQRLVAPRSAAARRELGRYIVSTTTGNVIASQCDLTELGRELNVLTPSETVEVG